MRYLLALFAIPLLFTPAARAADQEAIRAAATKSLALLQNSAGEYTKHRKCFSCHHQAMPVLAITAAKLRGFEIDETELKRQLKWTWNHLDNNRDNYSQGRGQGGQADTAGYALWTLNVGGWKADATTDAVIEYLLRRDKTRGYWQTTSNRPPSEASPFTTTFLALAALKRFGPEKKQEAIDARIDKALKWLRDARVKDTEDHVFRLRALKLAGAEDKEVLAATMELVKQQRPDGGWRQNDKLQSDAYATGSVLAALHQAGGLPTDDEAFKRGIAFLIKTQKDDGSWHVVSRSRPFQTYFESGFPHGKDQFISSAASSWATIALVLASRAP